MSEVPSNLQDMVKKYGLYLDKTLNGKIFEIVQFWMTSAEIVGLILFLPNYIHLRILTWQSIQMQIVG